MAKSIRIRKGLDIRLVGSPEKVLVNTKQPSVVNIRPTNILGLTPKMVVKEKQEVLAGSELFYDKNRPEVKFTSPVSGEIAEVIRGAKRRIIGIKIVADAETRFHDFGSADPVSMDREAIKAKLLESGCWAFLRQRPFSILAKPSESPKAIYISANNTNPLAGDDDFMAQGQENVLQTAVDAISKLTDGKVYVCVSGEQGRGEVFGKLKGSNVEVVKVSGPHPAGNVGVQAHAIDPINKGEVIWYINPQDLLTVGKLFVSGHYNAERIIAVGGSGVKAPKYYRTVLGAPVASVLEGNLNEGEQRVISGSVLSGEQVGADGFIGFYDSQVSVIPEETQSRFFMTEGWLAPGFNRHSVSRAFPTWIMPKNREFDLNTSLNGEERGFVVSGQYEKVFPFDIYPVQLIKAIMANDIELMENLGVYEIDSEDFALCEYVCTSKINVQNVVAEGLEKLRAELG